jgi:UDP-glucose 4-epimerase
MTVCLVTGGAGFIGSHIVEALVARGDSVRVLDNLASGYLENLSAVRDKVDFIEGSVQDQAVVQKAVEGVDYIFHLAAVVSVPQSMAEPMETEYVNAVGTLNLLQAAKNSGVKRLVLSSTCAVYGDEPTLPKVETMRSHPKSPYAITKLAAENYCQLFNQDFGIEAVVLRYFNVFGPRQDPSSAYSGVISIFVDRMLRGEIPTVFGDGEQTRDFVFVADVVRANLLAAQTPQAAGQILNIGTGRQISINQLFEALAQIFEVDFAPRYEPARAGDIVHSYGNVGQVQSVLGWSAQIGLEEGLELLVQSVKQP